MAGLEGEIKTPLGPVSKKTALLGGGLLAVIVGIVWYRSKQQAAQDAASQAGANTGIDPATGYPYGSAEDAAALENQGAYINPTQPYAPGGGGGTNATGGFTSNAQWVQAAEQYIVGEDITSDSNKILSALGAYVTGSPVVADEVNIINQAIGVEGYPPISGPNGYPPSINTSANSTPPPTGSGVPSVPANLHIYTTGASYIGLGWEASTNAYGYRVYMDGTHVADVQGLEYTAPNLQGGGAHHTFQVSAYNGAGESAKSNSVTGGTTGSASKPGAPGNLHVYSTGKTYVGIAWTPASNSPYGYRVFLNGTHVGDTNGTQFTFSNLKAGTYTLGVTAYNAVGESNQVTVKGTTSK